MMSSRYHTNEVFAYAPEYHSFRREDRDWERIRLGTKSTNGNSSSEAMACPPRGTASSNPSTLVPSPANYAMISRRDGYGNSSNPGSPLFKSTQDYWRSHNISSSGLSGTMITEHSTPRSHCNYFSSTQSESSYGDGAPSFSMPSETERCKTIRIDDQIHFVFSMINGEKKMHSDIAVLYPHFVPMHNGSDDEYDEDDDGAIIDVTGDYDSDTNDSSTTSNNTPTGKILGNKKRVHTQKLACPLPLNTDLITLYPEYSITFMLDMRYSMASTDTEYSSYLDRISYVLNKTLTSLTKNITFEHVQVQKNILHLHTPKINIAVLKKPF